MVQNRRNVSAEFPVVVHWWPATIHKRLQWLANPAKAVSHAKIANPVMTVNHVTTVNHVKAAGSVDHEKAKGSVNRAKVKGLANHVNKLVARMNLVGTTNLVDNAIHAKVAIRIIINTDISIRTPRPTGNRSAAASAAVRSVGIVTSSVAKAAVKHRMMDLPTSVQRRN
jgi:hypothetical protein